MFRYLYLIISFCLLNFYGCNKQAFTNDGLHIYPLEAKIKHPFSFKIKGGERHINKIDWGEDSLPTSAKSCHHGGEISSPQRCNIKAYYDRQFIYLSLDWDDKTKDTGNPVWINKTVKQGRDDGISLIFSTLPTFNCTETCHMSDWKVEESKFISDYRMYNDKDTNSLILLRQAKTKNKPILFIMDKDGKKTLEGERIFIINSQKGNGKPDSFQLHQIIGKDGDAPYFANVSNLYILNDKNLLVDGQMEFGFNHWKANVKIPISKIGLKTPNKGDTIFFAVAVFDGTQINHGISDTYKAVFE